jgi:glycosyltransferase involved in cell wall biosynthesis
MPRILRILNRFNLGGPTYNAAYLTKYMSSNFETMLVGGPNDPSEKNSEYIVKQLGVEPVIIPDMRRELSPVSDYHAFQKIKSLIRDFKPDIVHTHASKAGALGRHAALSMKVPVIVHTFHGHVFDAYFSQWKTSFYKNIEKYLAGKTDKIIAISQSQKYDLANRYRICPEDKIKVIPLGFDLSRFRENMDQKRLEFRNKYQLAEDEIAIGIIGRLVPIKNHSMFLEALNVVRKKTNRKIRAFIVGDGESREQIKQTAVDLGINYVNGSGEYKPALLTFTSWMTQMDQVNAGLDIVALTSLNEGTPVSLIEAQAAGKPIVSTRVGGIENVVIPGKTALLADKGDVNQFADHLCRLIENKQMRQEFSENGWMQVEKKFHFTRLVSEMESLYQELLQPEKVYQNTRLVPQPVTSY